MGCWYKGANARYCTNTVLASVSKAIKCLRTKIARQKREREVVLVDGKNAPFLLGIEVAYGSPFLLTRSTGLEKHSCLHDPGSEKVA